MTPDPRSAVARSDLLDRVRRRLAAQGDVPGPAAVASAVRDEGDLLGDAELLELTRALRADLLGAGPLEPLLADAAVTDVLVNGAREVWVDRGDGLERSDVRFADAASVRRLAARLAAAAGRRLDDAQPWVDARLRDGVRFHAVLPPVAPDGPLLSLRVPRARALSLDEMVRLGSLPHDGAALLRALVGARAAFVVSGGTGTGKTTLLAGLLSLVDPCERVLLVEDAPELAPEHPHVVRLQSRPANLEGAGAVTLRDLVRESLRMRPDRVVVGEVRGAEVVDLLAALNTGHEGGCATVHANAVADVPARLEALAVAAGLGREALHSQLASGLRVVVHLARTTTRRVAEVGVLQRSADGLVRATTAWSWDGRAPAGAPAEAWPHLARLLSLDPAGPGDGGTGARRAT
jgi:pilus assembly protein CpaF